MFNTLTGGDPLPTGLRTRQGTELNVTVFGATGQTGRFVVADLLAGGHDVTAGSAMSRADIAAFLVAQLGDDTFSRAAPAISN